MVGGEMRCVVLLMFVVMQLSFLHFALYFNGHVYKAHSASQSVDV